MYQLYVNVDSDGLVVDGLIGDNIIPENQFDFFFIVDTMIDDIGNYKVVMNGFKPVLEKK